MYNSLKTLFLMVLLSGILMFIGGAIGGSVGVMFAFIISIAMNFFSYWFSDTMVLKMYNAREITEVENPKLYGMVRRLTQKAQMPMPKVCIVPDDSPNAFATGRNPEHSAVAVTEGIMHILSDDELEGVISHELAHVKNRDTLISTVVAAIAGTILMVANMAQWAALFGGLGGDDDDGPGILGLLATIIVAPIAASLVQFAISRSREFMADSEGARIAGNKYGLINGLKKIHGAIQVNPMRSASKNTAHLMIANPFSGKGFSTLFSTHPSLEQRVENLMNG
jgi:heat shock protein HtpX